MKIAIVKLSALGDIVHAMVVLQFVKKINKKIQIDWIVEEKYKALLDNNPDISNIHVVNLQRAKKKKSVSLLFKEFRQLRKIGHYDLVIDMQGLIKSAIVTKLISSKKTIGFDKNSSKEGFSSYFYSSSFEIDYGLNVICRNVQLVSSAMNLTITKEELKTKKSFLYSKNIYFEENISLNKKNILLIPGASNNSKCYSVKKLAELTTLVDANFLIIWGSLIEKKMADKIKSIAPSVNICGKLSIDSLVSLISQVNLVIGPDTGPTHMAWALNIPSITLFGSTPGYRNSFVTNINRIIESNSTVNPYKINRNDYSINNIKVSEICNLTKKLLKTT